MNRGRLTIPSGYRRGSPARLLRQERGIGLLAVLLVMLLLSVLGAVMMMAAVVDVGTSANYRSSKAALYAADSGLQQSMADFLNDSTWAPSVVNASRNPVQAATTFPGAVTVNGHTVSIATDGGGGPIADWYAFGPTTTLGAATFAREIFLPPTDVEPANGKGSKAWITLPLRSTGSATDLDTSAQTVQADLRVMVFRVAIWDNAIFAGTGQGGQVINGSVQVRGSIHVVGDPANPTLLDWGGGSAVRNHYDGASDNQNFGPDAVKLPPLPTREIDGELLQTLDAELRVEHGTVLLGGSADLGEPNVTGDPDKETLDGVYTDIPVQYASSSAATYADYEGDYDIDATLAFPSLDDPYTDPSGTSWARHRDYLNSSSLSLPVNQIDDSVPAFAFSDASGNSLSWDPSTGTLSIEGIVRVSGDLALGAPAGGTGRIEYSGTGTLYATQDIDVNWDLLPTGDYLDTSSPTPHNLGLIADDDVSLGSNAQVKVMAAVYAEDEAHLDMQTNLGGSIVADYYDMGSQVPRIFQVPRLSSNLPPGMPGEDPIVVPSRTTLENWTQLGR